MVGSEVILNGSSGNSPFIGAVAGAVGSGALGYLIGSLIKIKKWENVQIPRSPTLGVLPGTGSCSSVDRLFWTLNGENRRDSCAVEDLL